MNKSMNRRNFFKVAGAAAAVGTAAAMVPSALASSMKTPVMKDAKGNGVYNEWDKLEAVIVGRTEGFAYPELDWVLESYQGISEEVKKSLRESAGKTFEEVAPEWYASSRDQQHALAEIMKQHGVKVVRPEIATAADAQFGVPGYSAMFERDNTLSIDDQVINTYCRTRGRRKTHPHLFEGVTAHVKETGQTHISMPQPSPTADLKDDAQPYIEGGDVFVLGKDILIGHAGIASSYAGIEWIRQHFEPKGYRIHTIEISNKFIHLDCIFMTPRSGLAVCHLDGVVGGRDGFPEFMKDWEFVNATYKEAKAMGCNGINLAPNKTVIGAEHIRIINELEKRGVECVKLPYADASAFGGGPRCSTHPLKRQA